MRVLALLLVASLAYAQPSTVTCGAGLAGCGPAIVMTTATTLPYVGPAPSWVSSMLAAYMLDEPGGNTHVNAEGTASRNLTPSASPPGQDITNKIEGTAASTNNVSQGLTVSGDTGLNALAGVVSLGCWMRGCNSGAYKQAIGKADATYGYAIAYGTGPTASLYALTGGTGGTTTSIQTSVLANTYVHLVGTYNHPSLKLYKNGALAASNGAIPGSPGTTTAAFTVSDPANAFSCPGQLDECFITNTELSAAAICRICSCGVRGEQCACNGTAFTSTGRNASLCGSCSLPADCSAAAPS